MTPIPLFLSETGRGFGQTLPSSNENTAISSDSNRQPHQASAELKLLFPDPDGAGMMSARPSRSRTAECMMSGVASLETGPQLRAVSMAVKARSTGTGSMARLVVDATVSG